MKNYYAILILIVLLTLVSLMFDFSVNAQIPTNTPLPFTSIPNTSTIPSPTLTVIPDTTIVSLQNTVATQQIEIQTLQRDLQYEVRDLRWWFVPIGLLAAAIGAGVIQAYKNIGNVINKKMRTLINKYYYQLDVGNLDLHITSGLSDLEELLKSQGIYKISRFKSLGAKSLQGVTIVSMDDKDHEKEFINFIEQYYINNLRLNPKRAGFILYASTGFRIDPKTIELFPSTAVANTPWNLLSTVMILGRSVTPFTPTEIDDQDDK
jgi:hypothetical protein